MSLNTASVGSGQQLVVLVGDPAAASQLQSVLGFGDAKSLAGLYAGLVLDVPLLLNGSGTYDQQRSAKGTTGIVAVNTEGVKTTYSCGVVGFTPAATATDFWIFIGSGTKTGRLLWVSISGTATAAASVDIQLIKRITANTGSLTSATPGQHDSNDAAPTCTVNTYAANPTTGSSGGTVRSERLNLGAAGAAGHIFWDFTTRNGEGLVVRGTGQAFAMNWNGASVPSGTSLCIACEFSEES